MPDPTHTGSARPDDARCASDAALLASLPDHPALLVWPSAVWRSHLQDCERPRRCPHLRQIEWPHWWLAKMKTGTPFAADVDTALEVAMRRVNVYRGNNRVPSEASEFAREAVRDALPSAPQPVSEEWVKWALTVTGTFATWVYNQGEPLVREHVFAESTRRRYLDGSDGATHLGGYTRRTYRVRLDIMASILLGSQRIPIVRKPHPPEAPLIPLTRQQETDLWVWSQGLRPISVRIRIQFLIVMGLGVGARRRDFVCVRGSDVTRDWYGVHVSFPESTTAGRALAPARTVTCAEPWSLRLWDLVRSLETPDRYVASPWSTEKPHPRNVDRVMSVVLDNEAALPPLPFSIESLRNTWLLRHLEAGTPPNVFMPQGALLTMGSLQKLLPYMRDVDEQQTALWMRRSDPR